MSATRALEEIRILVLEPHVFFRESIARLLQSEADFAVVAECGSVTEAVQAIPSLNVDVVLVDYDPAVRAELDFVTQSRRIGFPGKILIMTAGLSEPEGAALIRRGIAGLFMKSSSIALLSQAIRHVASGRVWLDQRYLDAMCDASFVMPPSSLQQGLSRFSPREREILRHVANGLTNRQVADRLAVTESAVKASLHKMLHKTGLRSRSQLVRLALEEYWTEPKCV